jgi:hypothetical protein
LRCLVLTVRVRVRVLVLGVELIELVERVDRIERVERGVHGCFLVVVCVVDFVGVSRRWSVYDWRASRILNG